MWCNSIETVKPAVLKLYLDYSREMHASCSKTIAAGEEEIGWLTGRSKTSWPSTSVSRYPDQCGGSGEPMEQLRQATISLEQKIAHGAFVTDIGSMSGR